jgi:hypothetical protein
MCSCVLLPCSPKKLQIRVSLFHGGTGGNQIGCHRVSDMTVALPPDHANPELISGRPSHLFPYYVNSGRW